MNNRPCKKELLHWIDVVSFAVDDTKLFLDTHPDNAAALAYFQEYTNLRRQALEEYAKYYGPLTIDSIACDCSDHFNWINEPWPWQEGGC